MVLDSSKLVSVSVRGISNFRKRRTISLGAELRKERRIFIFYERHI